MIGTGKMGQAIIGGLIASGVPRRSVTGIESSPETRAAVSKKHGIRTTAQLADGLRQANVVLLAVKPQQLREVTEALADLIKPSQLVVSIAAGITLDWLEERLGRRPLMRVMPNLPATAGAGFSAIAASPQATARQRSVARALFSAVGETVEVPESQLDAITAVSGSGPAYVFFLMRAWQAAASELGLSPKVAEQAVRKTLEGSLALLAQEPGTSPDEWIRRVASKGGTTEAALAVLEREAVEKRFIAALAAAAARSKELTCQS